MTCRLTFSSLSWSPLQSVFSETLKDFQTGLRLFMTVFNTKCTKHLVNHSSWVVNNISLYVLLCMWSPQSCARVTQSHHHLFWKSPGKGLTCWKNPSEGKHALSIASELQWIPINHSYNHKIIFFSPFFSFSFPFPCSRIYPPLPCILPSFP